MSSKRFEVEHSDAEWQEILPADSCYVLRDHGTERPFTSPLNDEKRAGVFACAGCGQALFGSDAKFDSGTGWPSFFQPIDPGKVGTTTDKRHGMARIEVHCSRCGGHLGHVFPDGPKPTGLRFCINGLSLAFRPGEA